MIVSRCSKDGCNALTIGSYCMEHDEPVTRRFVRGRPFTEGPTRRERVVVTPPRSEPRKVTVSA